MSTVWVSRRAFYHRQYYAQRVRGHSLLVLDLVLALRREIPGLGTRKLYLLLQQLLAASGIKMGRDIQRLRQAEIAISMTQQGDPCENAIAERVNGILKTDFRLNRVFTTFDEAARVVEQRVRNDNHLRPHMGCGYLTPAAAHASTEPLQKHWKPKVYKTAHTPTSPDRA